MAFENFPEVWAALGRLYDSIVEMQRQQVQSAARFDAMSERIERLASTIETMGSRIETLASTVEAMGSGIETLTERVDRVVATVATLAGTVGQLATVVEGHERRLERLEGH